MEVKRKKGKRMQLQADLQWVQVCFRFLMLHFNVQVFQGDSLQMHLNSRTWPFWALLDMAAVYYCALSASRT